MRNPGKYLRGHATQGLSFQNCAMRLNRCIDGIALFDSFDGLFPFGFISKSLAKDSGIYEGSLHTIDKLKAAGNLLDDRAGAQGCPQLLGDGDNGILLSSYEKFDVNFDYLIFQNGVFQNMKCHNNKNILDGCRVNRATAKYLRDKFRSFASSSSLSQNSRENKPDNKSNNNEIDGSLELAMGHEGAADLTPPQIGIVRVDGYDDHGFIAGDVQLEGSIVCFGNVWLNWNVGSFEEITDDSLCVLDLIKPPIDLVILGCGRKLLQPPEKLVSSLAKKGIALEALDTINAISTFNILNQEGRQVLGALLPVGSGNSN